MPVLDVVFEKGVFRPVKPVVLPDAYPSKVFFDEPPAKEEPPAPAPVAEIPQRPAPIVPDLDDYPDLGEDTYDIVAPPPEDVRVVKVRLIDAGPQPPVSYRDEE